MQAFMSTVHGVMDLEVGCVWRNYGDIYYLTDDQQTAPQVQQAIQRRWLMKVSDAEVKYASMDQKRVVGPKPPVQIKPLGVKADPSLDIIKRDVSKLNLEIQSLTRSVNSIIDLLSKGVLAAPATQAPQVSSPQTSAPASSINEQVVVEELFIPTFKVKESVNLQAETLAVSDGTADRAIEELKKMKRKKKNDGQES
jgi:hypothetical protein